MFPGSQERQCGGKVLYPGPEFARTAADRMEGRYKGTTFNHYECEFCRGWHIGRQRSLMSADRKNTRKLSNPGQKRKK